jgi:hypothetical protein
VAAYTEGGARGPSIYNDPGYNFWTGYVLEPIVADARAQRIAFVSTWINSNWETPYIPFTVCCNDALFFSFLVFSFLVF